MVLISAQAILLIHKQTAIEFLAMRNNAFQAPHEELQSTLQEAYHDSEDAAVHELIVQLCQKRLTSVYGSYKYKSQAMSLVALAAMSIGDEALWHASTERMVKEFDKKIIGKMGEVMGMGKSKIAMTKYDFPQCGSSLTSIASSYGRSV
jgi:hypothetical protein